MTEPSPEALPKYGGISAQIFGLVREFRWEVNRVSVLTGALSALSAGRAYSYIVALSWAIRGLGENFLDSAANRGAIVPEEYSGVQYLNSGQRRRTGELHPERGKKIQVIAILILALILP